MIKSQVDPESGDILPPFGIEGGTNEDIQNQYKKIRGAGVQENAMFLIKANASINTEAYSYAQSQMNNGKIKFLIDEPTARLKLMETKKGQLMTKDERDEYLRPFVLTSSLREQLLNLVQDNNGVNIILNQSNRGIPKDKFSSFIYGLYYIKQEEERKRKRKRFNMSDLVLFN